MEKQCADSLQCKLPCGGWPGPPGIQSIPSPLCIFITPFLRVSSWHFLNSHCSRNVLCPGWIRWVTWLGPGMHPITFSVTPTYISNPIYIHPNIYPPQYISTPIYIHLNICIYSPICIVCWNQFVTQFLSSELKVFSVLSVSVSNYGVGQCGLLYVCLSYALPLVLEAIGMPGMFDWHGKEKEQSPTNRRSCFASRLYVSSSCDFSECSLGQNQNHTGHNWNRKTCLDRHTSLSCPLLSWMGALSNISEY